MNRDARTGRFQPADPMTRFLSKCKRQPNGCLYWQGSLALGYGQFWDGHQVLAHRWLWQRTFGPIPDGKQLDHFVCDTRHCVEPSHLRPVTARENVLRSNSVAAISAAKQRCPRGHEYQPVNKDGRRTCRPCAAERQRRFRERRRVA